ncbi:MAG: hypothetical protein OHK0021_09640 [Bryobacter sp.]
MRVFLTVLLFPFALWAQPVTIPLLPPGPGNPRNTEGDFLALRDGRLLLVYTKFTSDGPMDSGSAILAARTSLDQGASWSTTDEVILENEAQMNVMSVTLRRLGNGQIGLFYLRKNSMLDCRPYLRTSRDESKTWSKPRLLVKEPGYWILNTDRISVLRDGTLVMPLALHRNTSADPKQFNRKGVAMTYQSRNHGKSWKRSSTILEHPTGDPSGLQEPGVVELKDGRLLMYMRTASGSQYFAYSRDRGKTWDAPSPSPLLSPLSPASIERIPKTGDLLAVWNNHADVNDTIRNRLRTPLTVALSRDEGKTWTHHKNLADAPDGWYCYTAIEFAGERVLLSYSSGNSQLGRLSRNVVTYFDLAWLYRE